MATEAGRWSISACRAWGVAPATSRAVMRSPFVTVPIAHAVAPGNSSAIASTLACTISASLVALARRFAIPGIRVESAPSPDAVWLTRRCTSDDSAVVSPSWPSSADPSSVAAARPDRATSAFFCHSVRGFSLAGPRTQM